MKYIYTTWFHSYVGQPIEIYNEIDEEGWEVRKVEKFADGSMSLASSTQETGDSFLSVASYPTLEEINAQSEFLAREISPSEFDTVWDNARKNNS